MSQHEIEDTVEGSVRALHEHDDGADLRDLFAGLFELQRRCDCSFTHGRVLPILVERRFAYRLPLASHPQYEKNREAFAAAAKDEILFVGSEILGIEPPDDEPVGVGHENGYVVDGELYCDAGTPLWRELVGSGVLTGADADAPRPPLLGTIALRVVLAAEKAGDADLVAMWINFGPQMLFGGSFKRFVKQGEVVATNPFTGKPIVADEDREIEERATVDGLSRLEAAMSLREAVRRMKAGDVAVAYDYRLPRERWTDAERWFWDP